ncbi:hypothetical protein D3C84_975220 [compost metagenome]
MAIRITQCAHCHQKMLSRSTLKRYCSARCQVAAGRAKRKVERLEKEAEFIRQFQESQLMEIVDAYDNQNDLGETA